MLLFCSSIHSMNPLLNRPAPKTLDQMNIQELNDLLEIKKKASYNPLINKTAVQKEIEKINKLIQEKENEPHLQQQTSSKKTAPIEQKNVFPRSKIKSPPIHLDNIIDVKKIVALQNGTVIILCIENNSNKLILKKLNENNWIDFSIPPQTETKIFKDTQPIINDIAVCNDKLAIATFYKKERKNLLGMSEDTEAVIYVYDVDNNESTWYKIQDAHKTAIKALFMDDNFVVSQSEAGNIRFFALNTIKSPTRVRGDVASGTTVVDPDAEYKAKNTLLYHNKCVIVEEPTVIFGNELYVKYIDDMADIIVQNKIGAYKKEDSCPYIGAINNTGQAVVYDQRSRSIIHTEKKDSAIKETIFKRTELPEELAFKVAKQIYYFDNTILLIYEDEVVSIDNASKQKSFKKRIVHYNLHQKKGSKSVIHTTCLNSNMLYVIIKQKNNDSEKTSFTMEDCKLEIKKG